MPRHWRVFVEKIYMSFTLNIAVYGCFRKWGYPQIIHFNRDFHYKPSILGYHYFRKHPYTQKPSVIGKQLKDVITENWWFLSRFLNRSCVPSWISNCSPSSIPENNEPILGGRNLSQHYTSNKWWSNECSYTFFTIYSMMRTKEWQSLPSWWLQPIWKILVKLETFPK